MKKLHRAAPAMMLAAIAGSAGAAMNVDWSGDGSPWADVAGMLPTYLGQNA